MEKFIEKLSSYNILNNMLPGAIFCYLIELLFNINLIKDDIISNIFIYYFCGMICSRTGSIIVEYVLKKIKIGNYHFIKFVKYDDFLDASKKDPKIEILSETNNTYRSILGVCVVLLITKFYIIILEKLEFLKNFSEYIIIIAIFVLFVLSYKKQTKYITDRVRKNTKNNNGEDTQVSHS